MKRLFAILLSIVMLFSACQKKTVTAVYEKSFCDVDSLSLDVDFEYYKAFAGEESVLKAMNAEIYNVVFNDYDVNLYIPVSNYSDFAAYGSSFPVTHSLPSDWYGLSAKKAAERFHSLLLDSYQYDSNGETPWEFLVEAEFGPSFKNLQSYHVWAGSCPGSAAISYEERGIVLDTNTGKKISIDELIPPENQSAVIKLLAEVNSFYEANVDRIMGLPDDFNVSEEGITFYGNIDTWAYDPDVEQTFISWDKLDELVDNKVFEAGLSPTNSSKESSKRMLKRFRQAVHNPDSETEEDDNLELVNLDLDIAYYDNVSDNRQLTDRLNEAITGMMFDPSDIADCFFELDTTHLDLKARFDKIRTLNPGDAAPLVSEAMKACLDASDGENVELWINAGFGPKYKRWRNYIAVFSIDTGGNHIPTRCKSILLDLENGSVLCLDDIVPEQKQPQVLSMLKNVLNDIAGEDAEVYEYGMDSLSDFFVLTSSGITWLYLGMYPSDYYIELPLPWSSLKGLVREDLLP